MNEDLVFIKGALTFMRDCGARAGEYDIGDTALKAFARVEASLEAAQEVPCDLCDSMALRFRYALRERADVLKLSERVIDACVAHWHASATELPLHEWLGLTLDEYAAWVERRAPFDYGKENRVEARLANICICGNELGSPICCREFDGDGSSFDRKKTST